MKSLVTPLCTLEPQTVAHAAEMFDVLGDPKIYEFENEPPTSAAHLAQRFARLESRVSPDGKEQWLNWVVRLAAGELAGYVQTTVLQTGVAFVAYELNSRFWRQGIGSAAVAAMMNELHLQYGVHTFVAVLKAKNHRSFGLLASLGFHREQVGTEAAFPAAADEWVMTKTAAPHACEACR